MSRFVLGTADGKVIVCDDLLEDQHRLALGAAPVSGMCALGERLLVVDEAGSVGLVALRGPEMLRTPGENGATFVGIAPVRFDGRPAAIAADAGGALVLFAADAPEADREIATPNETPSAITHARDPELVIAGTASGRVFSVCPTTPSRGRSLAPLEREVTTLADREDGLYALDDQGALWRWQTYDDAPEQVPAHAPLTAIADGSLGLVGADRDGRVLTIGGGEIAKVTSPALSLTQGQGALCAILARGELQLLIGEPGRALTIARRRRLDGTTIAAAV